MDFTGSKQPKHILVLGYQDYKIRSLISTLRRKSDNHYVDTYQIAGQNIRISDFSGARDALDVKGTRLNSIMQSAGLSSARAFPTRLTGILYIHPDYDIMSHGSALWENLRVLRALIGEQYLERVTIVVSTQSADWPGNAQLRSVMQPKSPLRVFYSGVPNPRIVIAQLTEGSMSDILHHYSSFGPQRFYAQDQLLSGVWQIENIASYLQQSPELASNQPEVARQVKIRVLPSGAREIEYEGPTDQADVQTGDNEAIKEQPGSKQAARTSWEPPELEQNQKNEVQWNRSSGGGSSESAYKDQPLDAKVQDTDNAEPARIIQTFDEINRLIEELAQLISEGDLQLSVSIRDLGVARLKRLAEMFGHSAGKPSLVRSLSGEYPNIEDFFFSAVRAILCSQLYQWIFQPFHPSLVGKDQEREHNFIAGIYKQMTCQEPQSVAGRWRTESFNSISRSSFMTSQTYINTTGQNILDAISELTEVMFDRETTGLSNGNASLLTKLVSMAESWNRLVKGSVVSHGDFQPFVYPYGCDFQPSHMREYAAKPSNTDYPRVSLATVELGLINSYSVGGNKEPEVTVLRKATIVSEKVLYW